MDLDHINEVGESPSPLQTARRAAPGKEWLSQATQVIRVQDVTEIGRSFGEEVPGPESPFVEEPSLPIVESPSRPFSEASPHATFKSLRSHHVANYLTKAKRQARTRRLRITGMCLTIGAPMAISGGFLFFYGFKNWGRDHVLALLPLALLPPGWIILCLGLLPSDRRAIQGVIGLIVFANIVIVLGHMHGVRGFRDDKERNQCRTAGREISCSFFVFQQASAAVGILISAFIVFRGCRSLRLNSPQRLEILWFLNGVMSLNLSLFNFFFAILDFANSFYSLLPLDIVSCLIYLAIGVLPLLPNFRLHTQAWLAAKGESAVGAAGVSVLLGASNVEDIISLSRHTFRAVSCEKLTEVDMSENKPNPALHVHTEKVTLGKVDSFLSHSWHDDPQAKWLELQAWRKEFKRKFRREPKLWIDKYCIDQLNIESSLSCLPVYLMGCQRLLILCGSTYLTRLWCLIELFTFKEMGGLQTNLECRLLARSEEMREDIEHFDMYKARCFNESETSRLLGVMEAGASSLDELRDWIWSN